MRKSSSGLVCGQVCGAFSELIIADPGWCCPWAGGPEDIRKQVEQGVMSKPEGSTPPMTSVSVPASRFLPWVSVIASWMNCDVEVKGKQTLPSQYYFRSGCLITAIESSLGQPYYSSPCHTPSKLSLLPSASWF